MLERMEVICYYYTWLVMMISEFFTDDFLYLGRPVLLQFRAGSELVWEWVRYYGDLHISVRCVAFDRL